MKTPRGIKTTVEFPEELWLRAKRRALDEWTDFRTLVIEGLELRLAQKQQKRGGSGAYGKKAK
jgi:hypothetical protein